MPLERLADARWVLPTSNIAVRDIFERVVLARLPQAQWFPVSTVSLPVLEGLLSQPGAVAVMPRSIVPRLGHAGPRAGVCILDMVLPEHEALALAPLGAVYRGEATPALLLEMLALWRATQGAA